MIRVQIPAWTDHWMRGDRYGVVVKRSELSCGMPVLHVKLDKSRKVVRMPADDCQEIA